MMAFSKAVDAKDHYTNGHSERVAKYAKEIARRMGRSESEQEVLYELGLLHDIGKIGISEGIINKVGLLTDEEFNEIKKELLGDGFGNSFNTSKKKILCKNVVFSKLEKQFNMIYEISEKKNLNSLKDNKIYWDEYLNFA